MFNNVWCSNLFIGRGAILSQNEIQTPFGKKIILLGIAFGSIMIMLYANLHYAVIFSWIIKFIVMSFSTELPWTSCNHTWNTESCVNNIYLHKNGSDARFNLTFESADFNMSNVNSSKPDKLVSASEEFLKLVFLISLLFSNIFDYCCCFK